MPSYTYYKTPDICMAQLIQEVHVPRMLTDAGKQRRPYQRSRIQFCAQEYMAAANVKGGAPQQKEIRKIQIQNQTIR